MLQIIKIGPGLTFA